MQGQARKYRGWIITWGLGGVVMLLLQAVLRLAPRAAEAIESGLTPFQWGTLILWCAVSAYAEGHRGFYRQFAPRVVARAFHLAGLPLTWRTALAPAFCMSLFHATRRSLVRAWVLVAGICALVALVSRFPQPWRGIVDAGVVLGLVWGVVAIGLLVRQACLSGPAAAPDLPASS